MWTQEERDGVKRARTDNPKMSQRGLAQKVYDNYSDYGLLGSRGVPSIYGVIRRLDRTLKATTTTKGRNKVAA